MTILCFTIMFFICTFLVFYIYIGYPILIKLISNYANIEVAIDDSYKPKVSILIPAYNEEQYIEKTILNKLELNYPQEKLEVIVVSDESTDNTDKIVNDICIKTKGKVQLFRQIPRAGKTSGLNLIFSKAQGDIIVFSDANSIYDPDALTKLVRNFADKEVGYVTGKMEYTNKDGSLIGDGCSGFMRYENWLRKYETKAGSVVGVDGGIDAIRKSLYETLERDQQPDFVQPLKVVEKGYRVIYEPEAVLKEEALDNSDKEYEMRVRVILRALWAIFDMRHLLIPFHYPMYSFQLISHKLLRYLAFIPIIACLLTNIYLVIKTSYSIYNITLIGQCIIYALALQGKRNKHKNNVPFTYYAPYYFFLLNVACLHAVYLFFIGHKATTWEPRGGQKKKEQIISHTI